MIHITETQAAFQYIAPVNAPEKSGAAHRTAFAMLITEHATSSDLLPTAEHDLLAAAIPPPCTRSNTPSSTD